MAARRATPTIPEPVNRPCECTNDTADEDVTQEIMEGYVIEAPPRPFVW